MTGFNACGFYVDSCIPPWCCRAVSLFPRESYRRILSLVRWLWNRQKRKTASSSISSPSSTPFPPFRLSRSIQSLWSVSIAWKRNWQAPILPHRRSFSISNRSITSWMKTTWISSFPPSRRSGKRHPSSLPFWAMKYYAYCMRNRKTWEDASIAFFVLSMPCCTTRSAMSSF